MVGKPWHAGYRLAAPALLVLAGALAVPGSAWAACSAGPAKWMSATTGIHDGFSEGDVVVGWTRAEVNYYVDCEPLSSARMLIRAQGTFLGYYAGSPTFSTDHDGIGIQMEYRYITGISSSGAPEYSDWQEPGKAGTAFTAHAHYIKGNPTASLPVEVDYRFIALRDFSNEDIMMGDLEPLQVDDTTYSLTLQQLSVEGVRRRAAVSASCEFSSPPPATVKVPSTSIAELSTPGDTGPSTQFSFSWRCRTGNVGHSGRGDFRFDSTAKIDGQPGRLSTTGDAEGVDMLVTLRRASGAEEPIQFQTWYANILMPGAWGLPSTGSQDMQVRFIRNAKPLKPGTANSVLTITAVPY